MIVQALIDQGVDTVFGYPGGAVLPIYDEVFQQNSIKHVLVRHEQGAVHAAEGYARSTGKPGVVLVTSGPGATNAVTGLTDALLDSIPLVVLTGQVPTFMIGSDAFQEADTVGITRPCTKHNWLVKETDKLGGVLHEAFHVATSGRPGPVLVDIPKDVQFATGEYTPKKPSTSHYQPPVKGDMTEITELVAAIETAKRPIFYTGGGVINSGPAASQLLRELVEGVQILRGQGTGPGLRRTGGAGRPGTCVGNERIKGLGKIHGSLLAATLGDHRQDEMGRPRPIVEDGLAGRKEGRLRVVVATRVVVPVEIGEVAAGHIETYPVARSKQVAGRIELDRELVGLSRPEQRWGIVGVTVPRPYYPVAHLLGESIRPHVDELGDEIGVDCR